MSLKKEQIMNKAILIHILGTILYLLCFMYVTNGIELSPLAKGFNIYILVMVNLFITSFCLANDLYNKK